MAIYDGSWILDGSVLLDGDFSRLSPGSMTIDGKSAALYRDGVIKPDAGAVAVSGQNAGLYRSFKLFADAGSLNIAGSSITLLHDKVINLGPGSIQVVGKAAALTWLVNYGTMTITGYPAALAWDRKHPGTVLSDTHYLKRSGRYANPANSNDLLPLVYGDHTDGTEGIWAMPCIDTVNFVYCYAGHTVLSAAGGNAVTVYVDGVAADPADYTFSEDDNFERQGPISTITFTSDKANSAITVRGKGKVLTGTTLMENAIDIVNDFLTVESYFPETIYEETAKARASQLFDSQSYKSAGVIKDDNVIWDVLVGIMSSFLGSVFVDGEGSLVLAFDCNQHPGGVADIISRGDAFLADAKLRLENIINQCPCSYAYNYVRGEFRHHTDDPAHADLISQNVFGLRKPNAPYQFYWCRDETSVHKVQDLIVSKLKNPLYEIEIEDATIRRLGVDIGDHVAFTAEALYDSGQQPFVNQYWKITAVRPDYAKGKINFRALQTDYYLLIPGGAGVLDGSWTLDGSVKLGGVRDLTPY